MGQLLEMLKKNREKARDKYVARETEFKARKAVYDEEYKKASIDALKSRARAEAKMQMKTAPLSMAQAKQQQRQNALKTFSSGLNDMSNLFSGKPKPQLKHTRKHKKQSKRTRPRSRATNQFSDIKDVNKFDFDFGDFDNNIF